MVVRLNGIFGKTVGSSSEIKSDSKIKLKLAKPHNKLDL